METSDFEEALGKMTPVHSESDPMQIMFEAGRAYAEAQLQAVERRDKTNGAEAVDGGLSVGLKDRVHQERALRPENKRQGGNRSASLWKVAAVIMASTSVALFVWSLNLRATVDSLAVALEDSSASVEANDRTKAADVLAPDDSSDPTLRTDRVPSGSGNVSEDLQDTGREDKDRGGGPLSGISKESLASRASRLRLDIDDSLRLGEYPNILNRGIALHPRDEYRESRFQNGRENSASLSVGSDGRFRVAGGWWPVFPGL